MLGPDVAVRPAGVRLLLLALLLVPLLGACTSADRPTPGAAPSTAPPPTATAVPAPRNHACHQLTYAQAVAPTTTDEPVPCRGPHTSQTYAVGRLDTEVDGHLVAVDSPRVQRQVSRTCPRRLAAFLGATTERLRLSMLRPVWFTPSVAASDEGADWYRCDVIAVAGDQRLASLTGTLKGALADGDSGYAMCGTAEPGTPGFRRVLCREQHSWRALRTVDLGSSYPGEAAAKAAGQGPCQEAGRAVAEDALDFRWAYEWPTRQQWRAGQTYGICWAPES